jgi:hypothetical protein
MAGAEFFGRLAQHERHDEACCVHPIADHDRPAGRSELMVAGDN